MDTPTRKMQKRNDYNRHKLLRKIKRKRKAEAEQQSKLAEKELKKRLKITPPRYDDGKNVIQRDLIDTGSFGDSRYVFDAMNTIGISDQQAQNIENVASFLPFIGTAIDIYTAAKHPSLENIGWMLSDIAGGQYVTKVAKTAKKINKAAKTNQLIQRSKQVLGQYPVLYNSTTAKQASKMYPIKQTVKAWSITDPTINLLQNNTNKNK